MTLKIKIIFYSTGKGLFAVIFYNYICITNISNKITLINEYNFVPAESNNWYSKQTCELKRVKNKKKKK